MKVKELIKLASSSYHDDKIMEYWDDSENRPNQLVPAGDTLALFIANELYETCDESASHEDQITTAIRVLSRAAQDIDDIIAGLTCELV